MDWQWWWLPTPFGARRTDGRRSGRELVVVGAEGVRVEPLPRDADPEAFRFMASEVSAEKPKGPLLQRVVRTLRRVRGEGKKVLLVGGPAIIHTGAGPVLERLILEGWIDILFAGNALAVHDIEQALFGTSLGAPVREHAAVREACPPPLGDQRRPSSQFHRRHGRQRPAAPG
jgi:hypothetical protein